MRLLLCDDDEHIRVVLKRVAGDHGHAVVGETDTALGGIELLSRVSPDAVVVDLLLRAGSGTEVVAAARERGCAAVIFSAYLDQIGAESLRGATAVPKPDFVALEAALDTLAGRLDAGDGWRTDQPDRRARRAGPPRTPPETPIESPGEFYRAVADAWAGDTMMSIDFGAATADAVDGFAQIIRGVVRAQDHVMRTGTSLQLLLVAGGPLAGTRVGTRVEQALRDRVDPGEWSHRFVAVGRDELPSDAFARLRATTAHG